MKTVIKVTLGIAALLILLWIMGWFRGDKFRMQYPQGYYGGPADKLGLPNIPYVIDQQGRPFHIISHKNVVIHH